MKKLHWMTVENSGDLFTDIACVGPNVLIRTGVYDQNIGQVTTASMTQVTYQDIDPDMLEAYREFIQGKEEPKSHSIKIEGKVGSKAIELLEWFWDSFDTIGVGYAEQELDLDGLSDKLYEAKALVEEIKS